MNDKEIKKKKDVETVDNERIVIRQGQIWRVISKEFCGTKRVIKKCDHCGEKRVTTERIRLKVGEFIEIRYAYEWHFRTDSNIYGHAEPDVILNNAVFHGTIDEGTRFGNKHKLKEILEQKLYLPLTV